MKLIQIGHLFKTPQGLVVAGSNQGDRFGDALRAYRLLIALQI